MDLDKLLKSFFVKAVFTQEWHEEEQQSNKV